MRFSVLIRAFTALILGAFCLSAEAASDWSVARDENFEVYAQAGEQSSSNALAWFEQLRNFFLQQTKLQLAGRPAVRVIGFQSIGDYLPYRRGVASNAYYVGTERDDCIVMAALDDRSLGVAAHEYAHLMFHASGLHLPLWLNEGLAEFYSTIQIRQHETRIGGDVPSHSRLLARRSWIPLSQLLAAGNENRIRYDREYAGLFYAESWALTQMLVLSPRYSARFDLLVAAVSGDISRPNTNSLFGISLNQVTQDLQEWRRSSVATTIALPPVRSSGFQQVQTAAVSRSHIDNILAGIFLASGDLGRAENMYRNVAAISRDSTATGALAVIALMRHDRDQARLSWRSALDGGIPDADLCFRYAVLAQDAGLPTEEIRPALERAVTLRPGFDDARYNLALLESNSGDYAASLRELRAIQHVPPARNYSYWSCLGWVLTELDMRTDAKAAAETAMKYAATPEERSSASRLVYLSQTDLTVQFEHDSSGKLQLITARMPHNSKNWNPFIEPGDQIHHVSGSLDAIVCNDQSLSVQLSVNGAALTLAIPDPSHVQMRNAPAQFTCGAQTKTMVDVDYAADTSNLNSGGVVRGMSFAGGQP